MYYTQPTRAWALTDLGAANFFALQRIVVQQQATIDALCTEVVKLKKQLPAPSPAQRPALPSTAYTASPYANNRPFLPK